MKKQLIIALVVLLVSMSYTLSVNVTFTSCLSSFSITSNSGTGLFLVGQNVTGCAYNVTNLNDTIGTNVSFKYTGNFTQYNFYELNTFDRIYDEFTLKESIWVNTTHDWTRLCFDATIEPAGKMRLRYNFDNTYDNKQIYWNGSSWIDINTTYGCSQSNWIKFNMTG